MQRVVAHDIIHRGSILQRFFRKQRKDFIQLIDDNDGGVVWCGVAYVAAVQGSA